MAFRLTKTHKEIIHKAYQRPDHRVLGGAPAAKQTLVKYNYLRGEGFLKGYEQFVLTSAGIAAGEIVHKEKLAIRTKIENKANNRDQIKKKAELLDEIVDTIVNPEVGGRTFILSNGWKVKFDRSGPSKLIVQLTRQ